MISSHDLTGKVALITGASQGLGWQFAQTLSRHGAKVGLAARNLTKIESLKSEIEIAGGTAHAVVMDVRDTASIDAGVADEEALHVELRGRQPVEDLRRDRRHVVAAIAARSNTRPLSRRPRVKAAFGPRTSRP